RADPRRRNPPEPRPAPEPTGHQPHGRAGRRPLLPGSRPVQQRGEHLLTPVPAIVPWIGQQQPPVPPLQTDHRLAAPDRVPVSAGVTVVHVADKPGRAAARLRSRAAATLASCCMRRTSVASTVAP